MCVPPIRMVCALLPSWSAPWEVQYQDIIIEHKGYYNLKCTSYSRHYIIIVHKVYNTRIVLKIVAVQNYCT